MVLPKRAAALSAAVAIITARRYEFELPDVGQDERLTDADVFEALTAIAVWLAKHSAEGDRLLRRIGEYAVQVDAGH